MNTKNDAVERGATRKGKVGMETMQTEGKRAWKPDSTGRSTYYAEIQSKLVNLGN